MVIRPFGGAPALAMKRGLPSNAKEFLSGIYFLCMKCDLGNIDIEGTTRGTLGMTIHKEYISKNNTYEGQNRPKYIVIHETDNFSMGADAKRHASAQAAGNLEISVHYYVGSDGIWQAAEHGDGVYAIG